MSKKLMDINLKDLIQDATIEMEKLNYAKRTIEHYNSVWKRYLKFISCTSLNEEDIKFYLKKFYNIKNYSKLSSYQQNARRAMHTLAYFKRFKKIYMGQLIEKNLVKFTPFDKEINIFLKSLEDNDRSETTILDYKRVLGMFIPYLTKQNICVLKNILPAHITGFIVEIAAYKGKVSTELSKLRNFFRYLYENGYHSDDLSLFIPKTNVLSRRKNLPSYWTQNDIKNILKCVDIKNPTGKRDYAIILLATRLGLRVSDIANLKFDNLNWEKNTIELIQIKTKKPLSLPLLEDVGEAIIDYLKNGRPKSNLPNIFLRHIAPYCNFSKNNRFHYMITKYMRQANIEVTPEKSHGMHSIRHSLATELLKKEIPLNVISEILGHKNINSTAEYIRVDVEQLRKLTLPLEV